MTTVTRDRQQIEERRVLARVLKAIIKRRLTALALFTLESLKPLSFIASQSLIVFGPLIRAVLSVGDYDVFVRAIEDRDNIEWMIRQLEAVEERRGFFGSSRPDGASNES